MNKEEVSAYLNEFYMEVSSYMNSLLLKLNEPNITKEEDSNISIFIVNYIEKYIKIIFCLTTIYLYSKDINECENIEKDATKLNLEWEENKKLFEDNKICLLKSDQIDNHKELITKENVEKYTDMMNNYKPDTTELDKLRSQRKKLEEKTKKLKEENKVLQEQLIKSKQKLEKEEQDFLKSKGNRFKSIDEYNAYTDGYLDARDEIIELLDKEEEQELEILEKESKNFIYRIPVIAWFIKYLFNKNK